MPTVSFDGADITSAVIAVATGLAVAVIVEVAVWIRAWLRRRTAVSYIRSLFEAFETKLSSIPHSDGLIHLEDGPTIRLETLHLAMWEEHLDLARRTIPAHSPYLSSTQFTTLMGIVDGMSRLSGMIPDGRTPDGQFYRNYFNDLEDVEWLRFERQHEVP